MYYYTCETQRLTLQMGLGGNGKEKEQAAFKANKSLNTKGTHATRIHHVITAQHTTVLLDIFCSFWLLSLLSHEKSWQIINYLNYLTMTVFSVVQMNNDNKNQEYKIMLVAFARLSPLFFFFFFLFLPVYLANLSYFQKSQNANSWQFLCYMQTYGLRRTNYNKKNLTGQKKGKKEIWNRISTFQVLVLRLAFLI